MPLAIERFDVQKKPYTYFLTLVIINASSCYAPDSTDDLDI